MEFSKEMSTRTKKTIILSLTGGLGNQLFQMAAAVNIASGGEIQAEWDLGLPRLNQSGKPDIFEFNLPSNVSLRKSAHPSLITRKTFSVMRRINVSSKKYRDLPGMAILQYLTSFVMVPYLKTFARFEAARGVGFTHINEKPRKMFLTGYFQSHRWASDSSVKKSLDAMEILSPSPKCVSLLEIVSKEKPLIIHVRLGDYLNEKTFGIPDREYYKRGIERLKVKNPQRDLWVFSNDVEMAKEYLPREFSELYNFVDDSGLSACETLEVMRYGSGYVIGNSSFSWWAAFLAKDNSALVVAPTPWFRLQESPLEITPPGWQLEQAWHSN
jgi:hypothetical protein